MEEEFLQFHVEGVMARDKENQHAAGHDHGDVRVPNDKCLSQEAAQVLEALRAVTQDTSAPDHVAPPVVASEVGLLQLGRALAARLPWARFSLRMSTPKRCPPGATAPRAASWALHNLRHALLVATTCLGEELLVETSFRAHFTLHGSSASYTQLLQRQVPDQLVLPAPLMHDLVTDLARCLALEMLAMGRLIAPWRSTGALLSKWLPASFIDTPIPPPSHHASPAATILPPASALTTQLRAAAPPAPPTQITLARHSDSSTASAVTTGSSPEAAWPACSGTSPDSVLPPLPAQLLPQDGKPAHPVQANGGHTQDGAAAILALARSSSTPAVVVVGFEAPPTAAALLLAKVASAPAALPCPTSPAAGPQEPSAPAPWPQPEWSAAVVATFAPAQLALATCTPPHTAADLGSPPRASSLAPARAAQAAGLLVLASERRLLGSGAAAAGKPQLQQLPGDSRPGPAAAVREGVARGTSILSALSHLLPTVHKVVMVGPRGGCAAKGAA